MIFSWREENQRGQQERLDFVVPGNRKKQKLELKIGSWHKFQKGINSECTLEWKLWSTMEFTEPLLDFFPPQWSSSYLDFSSLIYHNQIKIWPPHRSQMRPSPLGHLLPGASASWFCTYWSCPSQSRYDLTECFTITWLLLLLGQGVRAMQAFELF